MSKILCIVAEYNPLHNGHVYHIKESKKIVDPDYTICIMSGNFVERGDTSIIDKWSKAEVALNYGFDLVIELPTIYSISSAENFANGALKILKYFSNNELYLSFGSETNNINVMNDIVDVLIEEPKEYVSILNHELSKGISFPKARENAVLFYLNDIRRYSNILNGSNDILAIEYLKALKRLKCNIIPISIKRIGTDYNSLKIKDRLASATAIRNLIKNGKDVKRVMPKISYDVLTKNINDGTFSLGIECFSKEIIYLLRKMSIREISNIPDVSEGLENRIKSAADSCNSLEELISKIKTKRYTQSRIQRILLYVLLNISKDDILMSNRISPYIRVLGSSQRGKILLSNMQHGNKKVPVITSLKKFVDENTNKQLKRLLDIDIFSTNTYTLSYKQNSISNLDYTKKLIIK